NGFTFAAFMLAVTLGAGNFIGVRFSNRELEPFWGAGLRFGVAAAIFAGIALGLRLRWPRGRDLWLTMAYGALNTGLFYALMYWALVRVSAGVATVVMAVVPLATVLLAAVQRLEPLRMRGAGGALLACAGIAWMAIGPQAVELPLSALLAMIGAAAAVAQSVILGKRLSANHPAITNAVGMLVGAPLLLALSFIAGEARVLPHQAEVILAVVYLVTLGSVGLFVLVLLVVRRWSASATSYMFVLFPVVTMLLDALIADEPITAQGVVGAALVVGGVWFGALSPAARRAAAPARTGEGEPLPGLAAAE
ncbi:MAG TPA: EamA family transporter, partial [Gemmatimonadales bacterium]|nr:EamA family transporter [Gemmatimonadales bacterium]